jgi:Glycosyl hydrolase catalytic core
LPRAALVLTLCLCLLAPAVAEAGGRTVPRGWLGTVADGPMTEPAEWLVGDWDLMAKSGVENVRTAFYWPYAQRAEGAPLDLARYDNVVLSAAREGLPVLPVVEGTPGWASVQPLDETSPPRDPELLALFLRGLVARYGPGGTLWAEHPEVRARPIRAWQIGNEPHLTAYFTPPPGQSYAAAYVSLLRTAAGTLRHADPGARVVLAGVTNRSWDVLRTLYRAGAAPYFDVAAVHPYTSKPKDLVRILRRARKEMRRAGDGRKPLWVTEFSWAASRGKQPDFPGISTTEAGQARKLGKALRLLAAARKRLRIGRVYWYTWLSEENARDNYVFNYSGLRRLRGGEVVNAPALGVFRAVAAHLYGR